MIGSRIFSRKSLSPSGLGRRKNASNQMTCSHKAGRQQRAFFFFLHRNQPWYSLVPESEIMVGVLCNCIRNSCKHARPDGMHCPKADARKGANLRLMKLFVKPQRNLRSANDVFVQSTPKPVVTILTVSATKDLENSKVDDNNGIFLQWNLLWLSPPWQKHKIGPCHNCPIRNVSTNQKDNLCDLRASWKKAITDVV